VLFDTDPIETRAPSGAENNENSGSLPRSWRAITSPRAKRGSNRQEEAGFRARAPAPRLNKAARVCRSNFKPLSLITLPSSSHPPCQRAAPSRSIRREPLGRKFEKAGESAAAAPNRALQIRFDGRRRAFSFFLPHRSVHL
jgi:hypothetical protein